MTINWAIGTYGEAAESGIRLEVVVSDLVGESMGCASTDCLAPPICLFPEKKGLGWIYFASAFEDVPIEERDHDPSYVVFEGDSAALTRLEDLFLTCASDPRRRFFPASYLAALFGCHQPFASEIVPLRTGFPDGGGC